MGASHCLSPQPRGKDAGFTQAAPAWSMGSLGPLPSKNLLKHTGSAPALVWAGLGLPCAGTPSWQCCHATSPFPHTKAILDGDMRPSVTLSGALGMTHVHQSTSQLSVLTDLLELWWKYLVEGHRGSFFISIP